MQDEWDSREEGMLVVCRGRHSDMEESVGSGDGGTTGSVVWRQLKVGRVQEEP